MRSYSASLLCLLACAEGAPGASPQDPAAPATEPVTAPSDQPAARYDDSAPDGVDAREPGQGGAEPVEPSFQRTVAADAWLSCAIGPVVPGPVSCWGMHSSVVLSMTAHYGANPQRIEGIEDAVDLAVDSDHACAVTVGGEVRCWGFNHHAQLGLPKDEVFHPSAVAVAGVAGAVQVAVGGSHSCARLEDGGVACWGMASWGQLGVPAVQDHSGAPVVVPGVLDVVKLTASGGHTCALHADARVSCWGFNPFGEVGNGTAGSDAPPGVVKGIGPAVDMALNHHGTWILGKSGTVWFLGTHNSPEQVVDPLVEQEVPGSARIDAGNNRTCVTSVDGAVSCWSYHALTRWGTGEPNRAQNELQVMPWTLREVSLGLYHGCGRSMDAGGEVVCWGEGSHGQLGPRTAVTGVVVDAPVLLQGATIAAAYRDGTCAGREDGSVWCWGRDAKGRLGAGGDSVLPREVTLPAEGVIDDLALGAEVACRVAGGRVLCWGDDSAGQLDGNGLGGVVRISIGGAHVCALTSAGEVKCWGANSASQLGGAGEGVVVASLPGLALDVAAGDDHTCAVIEGREAYCWGLGKSGQLGVQVQPDPTKLQGGGPDAWERIWSKATPQKLGVTQVVRVAAVGDDTCAAHASGVSCYGSAYSGSAGTHPMSGGDLSADRLVLSPWGGCRMGATGARCFGTFRGLGADADDVLDGARSVALGSYACVVEANGDLRCYSELDVQALAGVIDAPLALLDVPL